MSEVKLMRYGLPMYCLMRVKTYRVHFYVEHPRVSNKYIRESIGRMSVETIHWIPLFGLHLGSGMVHLGLNYRVIICTI